MAKDHPYQQVDDTPSVGSDSFERQHDHQFVMNGIWYEDDVKSLAYQIFT